MPRLLIGLIKGGFGSKLTRKLFYQIFECIRILLKRFNGMFTFAVCKLLILYYLNLLQLYRYY